jgi:alkylhydroperoxidase/carboxymuconolactone decarboxylase family protein YurZ
VSDGHVTASGPARSDSEERAPAEARLRDLAGACSRFGSPGPDAPLLPDPLDERTAGLVRLAALVASGAPTAAYQCAVGAALAGGATVEEVVGTMAAVAPTVGLSRLVAATAGLSLALGYDIDAHLECLDAPPDPRAQRWSRSPTGPPPWCET